jgi:hypothetical protein
MTTRYGLVVFGPLLPATLTAYQRRGQWLGGYPDTLYVCCPVPAHGRSLAVPQHKDCA